MLILRALKIPVLNIAGNYAETVGYVCLPRTRTSTERCDVKLCLFLAVHVYVPSSALRCTVSMNSVPLATLCLMLVGSFTSPDNNVLALKGLLAFEDIWDIP